MLGPAHSPRLAVVIPAGGGGTRLWPRSRRSAPKQFLDIVTPGSTMLQVTAARVAPDLVAPSALYVITSERHEETVREQLPDVPRQNVIGEPSARDSAPAIGVMAAIVEKQMGPDTIMIVLPSDHEIENVTGFQQCLLAAAHAAQDGYLVTIGIHASSPDTGFGYIQRGESLHTGSIPVYKVRRFREKPDSATAQEYVDSGEYDWNAGMFIASVRTFRALYRAHLPEMEPLLEEMIAVYGTPQQEVTFARAYPLLPKISFDFAIAEKADKVAVVPASIGWSDVGSWARLAELLHPHSDERDNILFGHRHQLVDTHRSLIYAPDKMVALIGLEDIVVVDTPDAILIASKERSEDVKKIVDALAEEGRHDLL